MLPEAAIVPEDRPCASPGFRSMPFLLSPRVSPGSVADGLVGWKPGTFPQVSAVQAEVCLVGL